MPGKTKTLKGKSRKGGYYGFSGAVTSSGAGPAWSPGSEMGDWAISSRGANAQYGAKRKMKKRGGEESESDEESTATVMPEAPEEMSMGGRRRKSKKTQKRRKTKGGMAFCPPDMSAPGADGKCADGSEPMTDGGRRRKGKKRVTRRKMKGGSRFGAVSASYQGKGSAGLIDVAQVTTKYPPFGGAKHGAFNNAGAQPGSGFSSFVKTH